MSVRDLQIQHVLAEETRRVLQAGDPPQAARILAQVAQKFAARAAGAPRFWPRLWEKRKPIPIDGYNENLHELALDFATLFADLNELEQRAQVAERVLAEEAAALRTRMNRLAGKVQATLLELRAASTMTAWHVEDFTSSLHTDLERSTAVVDAEFGRLSMPLVSSQGVLVGPERLKASVKARSGRMEVAGELAWVFSPSLDESVEIVVTDAAPTAGVVLTVQLDAAVPLSRLRLDAVSGTSYGLRIEAEHGQESYVIYDGVVSFPLDVPIARTVGSLRFTFALLDPIEQTEDAARFRLLIQRLQLFEERAAGEAVWYSIPLEAPANALWASIDWQGHEPEDASIDGFVELYGPGMQMLTSFPVQPGQIFPVRQAQKVTAADLTFSPYPGSATLPLWQTQELFPDGLKPIEPKLWFGYGQWKQRVYWRPEFNDLPPQHVPAPQDWADFRNLVVPSAAEYSFYVDHGPSVPLGAMPADRNVFIALSCHVKVPSERTVRIPALQASGLRLSLYVNGRQMFLADTAQPQAITFLLHEGWNTIQIYGRTLSDSPVLSLGQVDWGEGAFMVAERETAIWVDPYTLRRSSPARPHNLAAVEGRRILIGINPQYSTDPKTHLKCLLTYTLPQSLDARFIVLGLRLAKDPKTPGAGPTVSRVVLRMSGAREEVS